MNAIANFFQNLFSPIVNLLGEALLFFHQGPLGAPWWLSIVLLTVIVRSLLFPLTVRQVRSMRAMQDLKPEMDKIRSQYQNNRQKQQEEIMKLYQERKVNPLGGCLPILVQMPIFIGIFYTIRQFGGYHVGNRVIEPAYESFHQGGILWFQNLSVADPTYLLPILSAVTMLASTEITAKNIDPQQRWLMRLLPIVFTVFLINFPAGLFMYWITSNLVTLIQNYVIYNFGPGRKKAEADTTTSAKSNATPATPATDSRVASREDASKGYRPRTETEDGVVQAAKTAKRKRRKKKK